MTDDLHDLIGAYAMDALSPDEAAEFEFHLETCETCRAELVELSESLAGLAELHEVAPPATLRDAVLGAVADLESAKRTSAESAPGAAAPPDGGQPSIETFDGPAATNVDPESTTAPPEAPAARQDSTGNLASVTRLPRRSAGRARRSAWQVLVAAAVTVIAVLGVTVWQPWAPRTITAGDVLAASDAVRATGTVPGGATVTVVRSNQLGRAVLVTQALPDAPSGKVRQAWIQRPDGALVSGGLMPSGLDVTVLLEGDARNAKGAGISLEPPGGSQQPGPDVVVLVGL